MVREGYPVEPFYCLPNLTNAVVLELCSLSPDKGQTRARASETQMLPHTKDKSNPFRMNKMMGATKSAVPNLLLILETDDAHLVQDERVLGRDLERLREEPLGQLGVVGQPVLDADVQQRKVAPGGRQAG